MSPLSASSFSSPLFTLCLLDVHTCTTQTYGVGHLPHSPANKEFEKDIAKRYLIFCKYLVGIFFSFVFKYNDFTVVSVCSLSS